MVDLMIKALNLYIADKLLEPTLANEFLSRLFACQSHEKVWERQL